MREIINAPEGRSACIEATLDGLPAIAGVDPMLNHVWARNIASAKRRSPRPAPSSPS